MCEPDELSDEHRKEIFDKFWAEAKAEKEKRAKDMPTEQDAINKLHEAYRRLKELGWNDPCYCPKDGTMFDAIEIGSTGIHDCFYDGEWPDGFFWVPSEGDLWPSSPVLFKKKNKIKAEYKYKDLKGRVKTFLIPGTAHKIEIGWFEEFGAWVAWMEGKEHDHHHILDETANESDLDFFKDQLKSDLDEIQKIPRDKARCETCGSVFHNDDPDEIDFMKKAREEFGEDIKREALIIVCEDCKETSKKRIKDSGGDDFPRWIIRDV